VSEEHGIEHLPLGVEYILAIPALIRPPEPTSESIANAVSSLIVARPPPREVAIEIAKSAIAWELTHLTSARYSISVVEDAHWGFVYVITLEASAREALEVNLELQRRFPGIPVVVRWTGGTDLPDEELVDYVVKIARAGGFKARAPRGFSSVEAVREVRGK
jgi:hypothetical protein